MSEVCYYMGMISFIIALVLLGVALLALGLQRTYSVLSAKELKRRAREEDPLAMVLYRAVAYGASLRLLLWLVIVAASAGSFVIFGRLSHPILAFLAVAIAIGYGFIWMPAHRATKVGMRLAVWLTPAVAWVMRHLYPVLNRITDFIRTHRPIEMHTGLYDRDDLLKLIERQKHQPDSRISTETLELLSHTLTFGDKLVRDSMVPRRAVRMVSADEPVGPVLIKDLYDSGFSRFPVHGENQEEIIGTLYLRDLVNLKHTGTTKDVMKHSVYYVHEDYPLEQVLDAFLKTKHHLFVVVNSFEEIVGLITIEDIIEQILGCKIVDEFDQYDDVRAVAAHQAHARHVTNHKKGQEVVADQVKHVDNPFTEGSLKHLLYQTGFRDEALEIAFAVALGESSGKASAHNDNAKTGDDSYGLFQINMLGDMGPERRKKYKLKDNKDLFDPATNARVAFDLSEQGANWKPWSVYNNGTYKKHYNPKADASIND